MLEYASIRLRFVCTTATTVPRIIVAADTTHSTGIQSALSGANAEATMRTNAANAAALTAVDMNPATMAGAPS